MRMFLEIQKYLFVVHYLLPENNVQEYGRFYRHQDYNKQLMLKNDFKN